MTEEELKAIEALVAKATPGPWIWNGEDCECPITAGEYSKATYDNSIMFHSESCTLLDPDGELMAASRAIIPSLIAEVRRQNQWIFHIVNLIHGFKIPDGWRMLKNGETFTKDDVTLLPDGWVHEAPPVGMTVQYAAIHNVLYIREIKKDGNDGTQA